MARKGKDGESLPVSGGSRKAHELQGASKPTKTQFIMVSPANLRSNPNQPRQESNEDESKDLMASISDLRDKGEGLEGSGILVPLSVMPDPDNGRGRYFIVKGERRWVAAKELGIDSIPVLVQASYSEESAFTQALVQHLQTSKLSPLDEAAAIAKLMEDNNLSVRGLGKMLGPGKGAGYVQRIAKLHKCADDVKELVRVNPDAATSATEIDDVKDTNLRQKLIDMVKEGASSREVIQTIKDATSPESGEPSESNESSEPETSGTAATDSASENGEIQGETPAQELTLKQQRRQAEVQLAKLKQLSDEAYASLSRLPFTEDYAHKVREIIAQITPIWEDIKSYPGPAPLTEDASDE